jgi:hypothetical protein
MLLGTVTNVCPGDFFVVRYRDNCCAAFETFDALGLKVGDAVRAELDKVGLMVMRHVERNKDFEVFAHTGESCLIACLLLIELLRDEQKEPRTYTETEELVFKKFFGDSSPGIFEDPSTIPRLL